jgi:transcriptional regulator GlxA family with amidase domain
LVSAFLIASLGDLHRTPGDADPLTPLASGARKLAMAQLSDPDLGVSSLARQLGCHPDHLSRSFQKSLGVPLGEWIIRERIQTARGLLQNSPHNVAEVCWACGFSNPSYFIKVFRTRTGQTPGQFRKASAT